MRQQGRHRDNHEHHERRNRVNPKPESQQGQQTQGGQSAQSGGKPQQSVPAAACMPSPQPQRHGNHQGNRNRKHGDAQMLDGARKNALRPLPVGTITQKSEGTFYNIHAVLQAVRRRAVRARSASAR